MRAAMGVLACAPSGAVVRNQRARGGFKRTVQSCARSRKVHRHFASHHATC